MKKFLLGLLALVSITLLTLYLTGFFDKGGATESELEFAKEMATDNELLNALEEATEPKAEEVNQADTNSSDSTAVEKESIISDEDVENFDPEDML